MKNRNKCVETKKISAVLGMLIALALLFALMLPSAFALVLEDGSLNVSRNLIVAGNIYAAGDLNLTGTFFASGLRIAGKEIQLENSAYKKSNITRDYPNIDIDSTDDVALAALLSALDNSTIVRTAVLASQLSQFSKYNKENLTRDYPSLDTNAADDQNGASAFKIENMTMEINKINKSISLWNASGNNLFPRQLSGKVGIGTASPGNKLHVLSTGTAGTPVVGSTHLLVVQNSGSAGVNSQIGIYSGNTGVGTIDFGDTDSSQVGRVGYDHNTNALFFQSNGVDIAANSDMTLDSSGRLGIGTTSPTAQLHIKGSTTFVSNIKIEATDNTKELSINFIPAGSPSATNRFWTIGRANNADSFAIRDYDGTTDRTIFAIRNGSVGIGTKIPKTKLSVQNGSAIQTIGSAGLLTILGTSGGSAVGDKKEIYFKTWDSSTNPQGVIGIVTTGTASQERGALYFATKNADGDATPTEIMRITDTGRVGIGTTSPVSTLEVENSLAGWNDVLTVDNPSSSNNVGVKACIKWVNSGNVGGTICNDRDANNFTISNPNTASTAALNFQTSNKTSMMIGVNGNIGIGTTTPTAKLDVNGEANLRGISSDGANKLVCIKSDGNLGTCALSATLSGTTVTVSCSCA